MTVGLVGCSPASDASTQAPTAPATAHVSASASRSPKVYATPLTTSTVGLGRKDAAHARLPGMAGDYRTLGEVIEATMSSSALYVSRSDDSRQTLAVLVRRPWLDVDEITKDLTPTKHGLALCGVAQAGHYCYVQLRGGFLNLTAPASMPVAELASLAGELYDTFA